MLGNPEFYSLPHDERRMFFSRTRPQIFNNLQNRRTIVTNDGYSYIPFDRHMCIFVHIPKTAGVSICRALFGNLAGGHASVSMYQIVFSKEEFDRYFKFTFV